MNAHDSNSTNDHSKPDRDSPPHTPRWVKVSWIVGLTLVLLFVILHLTGMHGGHGFMNHSMHNGMPGMDHGAGVFKIWGQFQHDGKVFTAPFVVRVP